MPEVICTVRQMQRFADRARSDGRCIGLVPTMGSLHEGHLSLIRRAGALADVVVVSVFVNPTQFGLGEDFDRYPRDLDRDCRLVEEAGGHVVFAPSADEMYPPGFATRVRVDRLTETLCGLSRPGHFEGVTTVVAKLLAATKPHAAVFGQKDAQQAIVVQRMVRDLNVDVQIVVSPTVREEDGLALSSRNIYLSAGERADAVVLYQCLELAKALIRDGERNASRIVEEMSRRIQAKPSARIDYVAIVDTELLEPMGTLSGRVLIALAVYIGKTRLIDNAVVDV